MSDDSPVTEYLHAWSDGDPQALEDLFALVYAKLREMSRRALRGERQIHTLNPTALVHEVYLRFTNLGKVSWENRAPFFAFASRVMRRVVVEYARAAKAAKRGGLKERVHLELDELPHDRNIVDALDLDDVLTRLETHDPFLVKIIELRFFSGLTESETAEVLGVNKTKIQREWRVGKRLLARVLRGEGHDGP
jgi:RNA polymerase sigma factor (TIGR02999 family)